MKNIRTQRPRWAIRLALIREYSGLSQSKFASTLGVSKGAYQFYEKGAREPSFATLRKINSVYRISLDVLLSEALDVNLTGQEFDLATAADEEKLRYLSAVSKAIEPGPSAAKQRILPPTPQKAPARGRSRPR